MRKILIAVLAVLTLSSCVPLGICSADSRSDAREVAGDIVQGTVRSVLAAPDPEEPWERTHLSYEDPLDEAPREQVVVRLDDGSEVTLLYGGPRHIEPGERVRVYLGERAWVLL
jgi:outer membrane lipoprotein SlyB